MIACLFLLATSHPAQAFSVVIDFAGIWRAGPLTGQVFSGWTVYQTGVPEDEWFSQIVPAVFTTPTFDELSTARIFAIDNTLRIDGGNTAIWQVVIGFDESTTLAGFPPSPDPTSGSSFFENARGRSTSTFAPQFVYETSLDLQRRELHAQWLSEPPPLQHTPEPGTLVLWGIGILLLTWRYHARG